MQLLYPIYYKRFGTRRLQQLLSPRLIILNSLPRDSMLHYIAESQDDPKDIDTSKPYFSQFTKRVLVDYPEEFIEPKGSFRKIKYNAKLLAKPFHLLHRKFKYFKDHYKNIDDPLQLLVNNYNYLDDLYKYPDLPMSPYYQWYNKHKTMWELISQISEEKSRQHFIFIDVPKDLPSFNLLNLFSNKVNQSLLRVFDTAEKLFLLELWKWIDHETRETSVMSDITSAKASTVNLVITIEDGRSMLLNLGYLNSWVNNQENTTEFSSVNQYKPIMIKKLFLKSLMILSSLIPEEAVESPEDMPETVETDPSTHEVELDDIDDEIDDTPDNQSTNALDYASNFSKKIDNNDLSSKLVDDKDIDTALDDADLDSVLKTIDEDLNNLDRINKLKLKEKGVEVTKDEVMEAPDLDEQSTEEIKNQIYQDESVYETLTRKADEYAESGYLSALDYKKFMKDVENYVESKDPYGSGQKTIDKAIVTEEDIKIDPKKTKLVDRNIVIDKRMLESSLKSFHSDYVTKVQDKHMLAMIGTIQKAGIAIKNHNIEVEHSALGSYEIHTLDLKPIDGAGGTIRFRVPKVDEEGVMTASGNKYVLRAQRVDAPIRKIDSTKVALTSYYGKTFVSLSEKKADSDLEWITKQLNIRILDEASNIIKLGPASVYDNNFKAPFIYNALADKFKVIQTKSYTLNLDHRERSKHYDIEFLKLIEKNGSVVIGHNTKGHPLIVDKNNEFHVFIKDKTEHVGNIYDVLELDESLAPVNYADVSVFSKKIPVGIVLANKIGFKNLIKLLNAKHRVIIGKRAGPLSSNEYTIQFKDQIYVFDRRDKVASMVLAGFNVYDKELKKYEASEYNKKNVYFNLLSSKGLGSLYIRELNLLEDLFVDSITKDILVSMNEPTTYHGLLLRSCELLTSYDHPDSQDMKQMRIRGYERIPGMVYKELMMSIRSFKNRNIAGKSKIEMSPYRIWQSLMEDPAKKMVEDINPIQNLKETEIVTYVGEGGRAKDAMNKESRAYHVNDMGIVSEATVDSSDVGINAYMSANPNFDNLLGISKEKKDINPTTLMSTSANLAPAVNHDQGPRVNFCSIQNSHTIAIEGARQPYVQTGYESVIADRTGDMFARTAEQDGKVISVTDNGIIVEYKDGKKKGVTLGRVFGRAEGSVYPHDVVTPLKEGQSFKQGDLIAYNTGFFEPSFLDPKRVVMKTNLPIKVALYESAQTHEDSSAISVDLSRKMRAKTTKVKSFTVNFKQNILDIVKVGQEVNPKTVLMIIEDEITSGTNVFDEKSMETLRKLSAHSPRSGYQGIIDRIEVFYNGDKSDMTSSLKSITDKSDRLMTDISRSSNKPVINGQVNSDYRVAGTPLILDKAEIKIYITIETEASTGD